GLLSPTLSSKGGEGVSTETQAHRLSTGVHQSGSAPDPSVQVAPNPSKRPTHGRALCVLFSLSSFGSFGGEGWGEEAFFCIWLPVHGVFILNAAATNRLADNPLETCPRHVVRY